VAKNQVVAHIELDKQVKRVFCQAPMAETANWCS